MQAFRGVLIDLRSAVHAICPDFSNKKRPSRTLQFLETNETDKIKMGWSGINPLRKGVVKFPTVVKSLRLAWVNIFLRNSRDSWKTIPNYQFFFICTIMLPVKAIIQLPIFYRKLLEYFQEFKNKTKIFSDENFLLWNNEAITISRKRCYFGNLDG